MTVNYTAAELAEKTIVTEATLQAQQEVFLGFLCHLAEEVGKPELAHAFQRTLQEQVRERALRILLSDPRIDDAIGDHLLSDL